MQFLHFFYIYSMSFSLNEIFFRPRGIFYSSQIKFSTLFILESNLYNFSACFNLVDFLFKSLSISDSIKISTVFSIPTLSYFCFTRETKKSRLVLSIINRFERASFYNSYWEDILFIILFYLSISLKVYINLSLMAKFSFERNWRSSYMSLSFSRCFQRKFWAWIIVSKSNFLIFFWRTKLNKVFISSTNSLSGYNF